MLAETRAAGSDIDAQQHAIERIRSAFGQAVAQSGLAAGEATLLLSGSGVFAVASRATIQREVLRLSLLSTTLVVLLLLAVYRSPSALVLGDNVWLGTGAKVLDGVRIGSDVVVGANAVVNADLPDGAIAAGVPARVLRFRQRAEPAGSG